MFSQREAQLASIDASVALATKTMSAAEEAFASAVNLNVETTLMIRIGLDTSLIRPELNAVFAILEQRLLEFDVLTQIVGEIGQPLLP
jgi:hypothetical protein